MSVKMTAGKERRCVATHPSDDMFQQPAQRRHDNHVEEAELFHLMSNLQLPRMTPGKPPSIRILAVADVDLTSAAALAEHALTHKELGGGNVDCIVACGPFARDDDLVSGGYLQGRIRRHVRQPHERSRQTTAALEGLVSSAISQLESIACRVVFVPHPSDPTTMLYESTCNQHLRLTSNSINIHKHWLPLAPGLGCGGYAGITDNQRRRLVGEECVKVQHGKEYRDAVSELLKLAPPSSSPSSKDDSECSRHRKDIFFSSQMSQTILVTQIDMGNDNATPSDDNDTFEWPKDHCSILDSQQAQSQVVLNIAATPSSCPPLERRYGKIRVIAPGSLRHSGDFCLIDVGVHVDGSTETNEKMYCWRVDNVEFRNMNGESG